MWATANWSIRLHFDANLIDVACTLDPKQLSAHEHTHMHIGSEWRSVSSHGLCVCELCPLHHPPPDTGKICEYMH